MTRWLARVGLAVLAAAAVFGLWSIRIAVTHSWWPEHGHHPRVLVFIGVVVGWGCLALAAVLVAVCMVWSLWQAAK